MNDVTVADPASKPEGYSPPESAETLLRRYRGGERYFAGARLADAKLTGEELLEANLSGAELARAKLGGANLAKTLLRGANLSGADLTGASLWRSDLTGANIEAATFDAATSFQQTNLTEVDLYGFCGDLVLDSTVIRSTRFPPGSGAWRRQVFRLTGHHSMGALVRHVASWTRRGFRRATEAALRRVTPGPPPMVPRWVVLRRTYTGTRFAWLFLLTTLFLLPLGWRAAFWAGVNQTQSAAEPALTEAAEALGALEDRLVARLPDPGDTAVARTADRIRGLLTPCLASRCDTLSAVGILLGVGEPPRGVAKLLGAYGLTVLLVALLLFNVARGWLTYRIGALRDVEEESGVSPARADYDGFWRVHLAVRVLQVVAVVVFLDHAIGFLEVDVLVPAGPPR